MILKQPILGSFVKAQVVAGIATLTDFIVLITFTEVFKIWYLFSTFFGALTGGIVGFLLGKYWAFMPEDKTIIKQAYKYIFTCFSSILLNVIGVYLLVDIANIQYVISKIIVSIFVGIGFNFFMHKYFVFK
ncbi:MAG: hypothetical protein A2X12_00785 [Bacteroidetes bacterium GWE2_29_8]|nr:MAG: hypothetical protein A2X12_00785 [Bacteroidetes bacterium GWE2_29_8]